MEKILVDSDVCLDSITARYPFSVEADQLLQAVEDGLIVGVVSAESFSNMFYILRKLSSAAEAIEQLKNLRSIVQVGHLKPSTIDNALDAEWTEFEDALKNFCAVETNCDAIVTRNKSDYKQSTVRVLTPLEVLGNLKPEDDS